MIRIVESKHSADGTARVEISERFMGSRWIETLSAMNRVAMNQLHIFAGFVFGDADDPEEVSLDVDEFSLTAGIKGAGQHDDGQAERKTQRTIDKKITNHGRDARHEREAYLRGLKIQDRQNQHQDQSDDSQRQRKRPVPQTNESALLKRNRRRPKEARQNHGHGIFQNSVENQGRHDGVEQSSQDTA